MSSAETTCAEVVTRAEVSRILRHLGSAAQAHRRGSSVVLADEELGAWRDVLLDHTPDAAVLLANEVLHDLGARPVLTSSSTVPVRFVIASRSEGDTVRLGLVGVVHVLVRDNGWGRVRVCDDQGCDTMFLDQSRNRSRRFCGRRCENRRAVAAHRERRARAGE